MYMYFPRKAARAKENGKHFPLHCPCRETKQKPFIDNLKVNCRTFKLETAGIFVPVQMYVFQCQRKKLLKNAAQGTACSDLKDRTFWACMDTFALSHNLQNES